VDELLQAIDNSDAKPREKTAESLDNSPPIFSILKTGGKSLISINWLMAFSSEGLPIIVIDVGMVRGTGLLHRHRLRVFDCGGKFAHVGWRPLWTTWLRN